MLSSRIRFELAMKRGLSLKQLKAEFPELKPGLVAQRITALGYRREYLTNEEWKHILARRNIHNATPAQ
jgi:hypothetical protein